MKKIYVLSGIVAIGIASTINTMQTLSTPEKELIEEVQRKKLFQQKEFAREPIYRMLDTLLVDQVGLKVSIKGNIDWSAVFHILDSMKGVIDVNEYRIPVSGNVSLLALAVIEENILAVKTLLEKYKANPNKSSKGSLLNLARAYDSAEIANLLIKHGAK